MLKTGDLWEQKSNTAGEKQLSVQQEQVESSALRKMYQPHRGALRETQIRDKM